MSLKSVLLSAVLLFATASVQAADAKLKPFVLASKGAGSVAETVDKTKAALAGAGFNLVGEYSPYADAQVLCH